MRTSICLLLILLSSSLTAKSGVYSLIDAHQRSLLKDLLTYLEENPDAPDRDVARQEAAGTAAQLGQNQLVITLLIEAVEETLAQEVVSVEEAAQMGMIAAGFASANGMKAEVNAIYELLKGHPEVQQSPLFIQVENQVMQMLQLPGIGEQPTLKGKTVTGEDLDLSEYRGKVVLLDFWATWCAPCMIELPTMLATYEKYHEKGFEIIGVSADRNRAALTGVMKQKGISWPNLYDNEQETSLVESFRIQSFPTLMLLDQTGTIVAMNTRGETLEKALVKLLDGKKD